MLKERQRSVCKSIPREDSSNRPKQESTFLNLWHLIHRQCPQNKSHGPGRDVPHCERFLGTKRCSHRISSKLHQSLRKFIHQREKFCFLNYRCFSTYSGLTHDFFYFTMVRYATLYHKTGFVLVNFVQLWANVSVLKTFKVGQAKL